MHQALQSNLSGCPTSFTWLCSSTDAGFDSTNKPSGRQASPNILPLGLPSASVPIWQPATAGETPSLSFHQEMEPSIQSCGLKSKAPFAPSIPSAPADGLPDASTPEIETITIRTKRESALGIWIMIFNSPKLRFRPKTIVRYSFISNIKNSPPGRKRSMPMPALGTNSVPLSARKRSFSIKKMFSRRLSQINLGPF